jgi:photosystem II stability/assembly factor-like uncharacterized protein
MRVPIIILSFVCLCASAFAEWESMGPYGGYLWSVVASPSDSNTVWVMSYSSPTKIARSTDGGASWLTIGSLSMGNCQELTIDPTDASLLYAAGSNYTHRSTDGGETWVYTYVPSFYFYGITAHPSTPGVLYGSGMMYVSALWKMALHTSSDSGATWTTTILYDGTTHSYARDIAVCYSNPDVIYVCGYTYDAVALPLLFKSTDGGATFEDISSNLQTGFYLYTVGVNPTDPDIVYLGASSGIYRSTDGGTTWTYQYNATSSYTMVTTPLDPDLVYCGAYNSIYKSMDAGSTWIDCGTGLEGYEWRGIAINPFGPSVIYAGNRVGAFKTTDAGISWFECNNGLNLASICSFAIASIPTPLLYTSCEEVGVFRTTDHGTSWLKLPTPLTCGNICEFAINPQNPDIILGLEGMG